MSLTQNQWFRTELGTWWIKQVQRVTWILNGETKASGPEKVAAYHQHQALQTFKHDVLRWAEEARG